MALEDFFVRDVTIVEPGATGDRYGNATPDWSNATRATVKGWVSQTATVTEQTRAAVAFGRLGAIETTLHVMVPADAPIARHKRVELDGLPQQYDVLGDPHTAWTPEGVSHVEFDILAVEG